VIRLDGVHVALDGHAVLEGVDLDVEAGETLALLGPSGSGKTTLLRVAAGLQRPDRGRVLLDGSDVTATPPHRRGIGLVFQDAVLFPHRDVAGNVGFGLPQLTEAARDRRVAEMLDLVGLSGFERRRVGTLSGGEAQRVALARALAPEPRALLLDEPLGSLDGPLRDRLRDDLRDLFDRLRLTAIHVTHDAGEAFALGRRVAVLRDGVVAQTGPPEELWRRPADGWVARFLGQDVIELDGRTCAVRPEAVHVAPGSGAVVLSAERRGPLVLVTVRTDDGRELTSASTALNLPPAGSPVHVEIAETGVTELPG
jgi:thiamine transport system ATP-binding protein